MTCVDVRHLVENHFADTTLCNMSSMQHFDFYDVLFEINRQVPVQIWRSLVFELWKFLLTKYFCNRVHVHSAGIWRETPPQIVLI